MDDNHHIDETFNQRFSDLKDHSANPAEQWVRFESSLNVSHAAAGGSASSTAWNVALFKMAASVVSVIGIAGITTQDIGPKDETATVESRVFGISSSDLQPISPSSENASFLAFESPTEVSNSDLETAVEEPAEYFNLTTSESLVEKSNKSAKESLRRMLGLQSEEFLAGLKDEDRTMDDYVAPASFYSPISYYAKAAIRIGNGESNSRIIDNSTALNGVLGLGLTYSISPSTFISVEANYLRRSGNGIERSKDYDIDPVVSAFSNSNYLQNDGFSASEFRVQKSLVATELSYLHLPVQIHVVLNKQSNASIGFFTDYLLSVNNESFMIYDSEHYITTKTLFADEGSKKGLNALRYGLVAGYQHSITSRIAIDARAMLPISSSYDRSSEYNVEREPNQLVDLNIGLIYKI